MKAESDTAGADVGHRCKPITKLLLTLTGSLVFFLLAIGNIQAKTEWPHVVFSKDGTPISYEIYYRGLRRPLCLQSRQSLPFMLAELAYGFPLKDASHAEDHAFKRG